MSAHLQNHQRNTALVTPTSALFSAAMTFENKVTILFFFFLSSRSILNNDFDRLWCLSNTWEEEQCWVLFFVS